MAEFENQEGFPVWGLVRAETLFMTFIAGKIQGGFIQPGADEAASASQGKTGPCQSHARMPVWMSSYKTSLKDAQVKTLY